MSKNNTCAVCTKYRAYGPDFPQGECFALPPTVLGDHFNKKSARPEVSETDPACIHFSGVEVVEVKTPPAPPSKGKKR